MFSSAGSADEDKGSPCHKAAEGSAPRQPLYDEFVSQEWLMTRGWLTARRIESQWGDHIKPEAAKRISGSTVSGSVVLPTFRGGISRMVDVLANLVLLPFG